MLSDFSDMPDGQQLHADVCIIGAGPAGVTLARKLAKHGHTVCLLESGGEDFEQQTQSLYAGSSVGRRYYPLEDSRLRFFGGTLHIWGGRCARLDDIDFEQRKWVAHSGWPISAGALADYYLRALDMLGVEREPCDERLLHEIDLQKPPFDEKLLTTRFWQFATREEPFALRRCEDLVRSENVHVALHANATHIQADPNASRVTDIQIRALDGKQSRVSAAYFVVACGGIENPRLLLSSSDVEANGIGNQFDQVGRYFMEHPCCRVGRLETDQAYALWAALRKRYPANCAPIAPALVPTASLQREKEILNAALTFKLQRDPGQGVAGMNKLYQHMKHELSPDRKGRRLYYGYRDMRSWFDRSLRPVGERVRAALGTTKLSLILRAEQAPNPDSRVRLSNRKDSLGMPCAELDWRLSAQDKHTVSTLADTLQSEFQRLSIGVLQKSDWLQEPAAEWPADLTVGNHPLGGYHHMGTTRMSTDPKTGVVDGDCRVHNHQNLYVAGSSVFPTSGWANPTLTIIALSLRLADHLHSRLRNR